MNNVLFYFLMFIIYSFFGWCFECVHMAITTKEIVNRGFFIGPIIPIYGIGLTLIVTFLDKFKDNFILLFILSFLLIATLEYLVSLLLEKIFHIRWWDYSDKKFNLNGRVCLNTMTIFMIGALLIIYFVNPFVVNTLDDLSFKCKMIVSIIIFILLACDLVLSLCIVNKYLKSNKADSVKDKTPEIRRFTKKIRKGVK